MANRLEKMTNIQADLTAQNSLDEALRLTDVDLWAANQPFLGGRRA